MTLLAQQQQALLDALFAWPNGKAIENVATYAQGTWARGLKAYQSHGHMLAQRTLQAAYPVLAQLLGADSFAALARAFWHAHPPARGDLAHWGGELAGFVEASDQLRDTPYLGDVARVEWALHTCAGAADRAPEPATFQLLVSHDPATLRLVLAPGCVVVQSAWPVASIVTAHLQSQPDFDQVGEKLRAGVAEAAVVWRTGYQPAVRASVPGEAQLLVALLAGRSLHDAVNEAAIQAANEAVNRAERRTESISKSRAESAASESPGAFDFNAWLPMAVQTGLLLGVELFDCNAPG